MGKLTNVIAQTSNTLAERMIMAIIESMKVSKQEGEQGRDTSTQHPAESWHFADRLLHNQRDLVLSGPPLGEQQKAVKQRDGGEE